MTQDEEIQMLKARLAEVERLARAGDPTNRSALDTEFFAERAARLAAEERVRVLEGALRPFVCEHPWKCAAPGSQPRCDARAALSSSSAMGPLSSTPHEPPVLTQTTYPGAPLKAGDEVLVSPMTMGSYARRVPL